ncbi:hypothetical protein [Tenacibaculum adriaticum]|nr:hypothetical protein [Tenacibaculum adriaticum]
MAKNGFKLYDAARWVAKMEELKTFGIIRLLLDTYFSTSFEEQFEG